MVIPLGMFLVTNTRMHISDPCYDYIISGAVTLEGVLPGKYIATRTVYNVGFWNSRTAKLSVQHVDYQNIAPKNFSGNIAVDSGQAGFFDDLFYQQNQGGDFGDLTTFFGLACSLTLSDNHGGIINNRGVVSDTGLGDGSYDLFTGENSEGKIVAASIIFIDESELEEC